MQELTIDKEFDSVLPVLTPEELDLLEASLESDGCKEEIEVWANHQNTIIDGHNRYRYCSRFGIAFKIKPLTFASRGEVINYIINKQLGRRNSNDLQKAELRGKRYNNEKKMQGEHTGNQHTLESVQNEHFPKTSEKLAEEYGVSELTIRRDGNFAKGLSKIAETCGEDVRSDLLSGKLKAPKETIAKLGHNKDVKPEEIKQVIEEAKKPKEKKAKTKPSKENEPTPGTMRGVGVLRANEAIDALKRIPKNDPLRNRGFQIVTDWIKANK